MQDILQRASDMGIFRNFMFDEGKVLFTEQMFDISQGACKQVIHSDYFKSFGNKAVG